ncbi:MULTISPECIES: DNA polymerase III subunit beta [unclassified Paenibacillus]|uniref:DNA polymerase III subunit beta n=1 Tax=unclassified Paenibacillus TaxID=185978 RepID=UPI0024056664|nr:MULTISPECIES: DNA polymerase III subunit beta [unclassified Paenibacillus]MDF9840657.1 DNA polymerase-3 subunit beta [Paenibacillus sp. PastF-2]MDF9847240.1 DNA polymerase-3 subunit beta [Paenibacillus sp. PastM-2]MDF9853811.1 DNA polymerase-3 subunit beta [Paenibacillus sp. PastF-1]MDH6478703.1 DNA polymerase-3 subunit beta [Paenibacillus sp. PastH-2]MDH6506435.1 DNA polymerase-3 subunit beta [Paenibacillus sp. PastM-3]
MLVEVTKNSLMDAVRHVIKAVAVNSPISILQGIHIQAGADEVCFTASNTSMTIQAMIPQDGVTMSVKRTGSLVIPSRYFYEIIHKLNDEMVVLEMKEPSILLIRSDHYQIRLCGMDSAGFPCNDSGEGPSPGKLQVNNTSLRSAIKQVAIVASTSESRPVLTGVSFKCYSNLLTLTATDGVRLASHTIHSEGYTYNSIEAIIPAKNLYEVSKMLGDTNELTEIEVSNSRMKFSRKGLKVELALIEGIFPSITNITPQSYLCEILVDKACLMKAVECVTVMAGENVIRLAALGDTLKLSSRTAEVGDIENGVLLLEMRGEEFNVSLNGKFLIDMLRNSNCTGVRIRYTGKTSPIVVLPADSTMPALFLITPVRTHN